MQRAIVAGCLSAAFAVALSAQAPAQQPPSSSAGTSGSTAGAQQTTESGQRGMRPMTLTGCLKAGDTAGTYELTNVEMTGRRGGATSTTGETAGGATSTTGGEQGGGRMGGMRTVMLNAGSDVNLAPHVGHKIEVTGTMSGGRRGGGASSSTTTGSATSTTGSTGEGQGAGSGMGAGQGRGTRTMSVTSVKMISETCQ
jgi:hypothetical protein